MLRPRLLQGFAFLRHHPNIPYSVLQISIKLEPENPCAYVDIKLAYSMYGSKYMIIWPPNRLHRSGLLHTFVAFSGSLSPFEQAIPMMTSKSELFKDGAEIVQWLKINGKGPS